MLFLLLIFIVSGVSLTVLLWVMTLFLQGYYYTEPTEGIAWRAPAAGFTLSLFVTLWCLTVVNSSVTNVEELPYDSIFRFKPRVDKFKEPVKEFWVDKKGESEPIHYKAIPKTRGSQRYLIYVDTKTNRPYSPIGVAAIIIQEENGEKSRYSPVSGPEGSDYRDFVDDQGWAMREYENGPTGQPVAFRWGRFLVNLALNFFHLALWFTCLWLVLRFHWSHALGLCFVLWLVASLFILPMILGQAGAVAKERTARENMLVPKTAQVDARMCKMSPSLTT